MLFLELRAVFEDHAEHKDHQHKGDVYKVDTAERKAVCDYSRGDRARALRNCEAGDQGERKAPELVNDLVAERAVTGFKRLHKRLEEVERHDQSADFNGSDNHYPKNREQIEVQFTGPAADIELIVFSVVERDRLVLADLSDNYF